VTISITVICVFGVSVRQQKTAINKFVFNSIYVVVVVVVAAAV